jgi:RNA polymerase sigma-70 factor (ECF subfamily)
MAASLSFAQREQQLMQQVMADEIDHLQLAQWLQQVGENRDKQAFAALFRFFAPKIQRISQSKYGNERIIGDIVQETMTNVWRKAHYYHPDKGAPTTWVFTVMRNVTFDILRKIKSNQEDTLSDDIWPIAEQQAEQSDDYSDHLANNELLAHLSSLPDAQQQVVRGFYFQELSQEELAEKLNLPLGTVKSRLRLALTRLKQQMGANND